MKKLVCLLLTLACLAAASLACAEVDLAFLDDLTVEELREMQQAVTDKLLELKKAAAAGDEDEEPLAATRADPVLVGQTFLAKEETYSNDSLLGVTITRALRGDASLAVVKSFNRYNARSIEKNQEWFLVMFRLEALESETDKISLSDYGFRFVSKDGVEYDDYYLADNPLEIKSLYVGSVQYAWFGCRINSDDQPSVTYKFDDTTAWFDPNRRVIVDTSAISYEPLAAKATGEAVENLQYRLLELGYSKTVPTGKYDSATTSAVKKFQKAAGLEATGAADEETQRALFSGKPL